MGRQRPPLRGLGDLPPQRFARRPQPDLRLANQRLVRPNIQRSNDGGKTWEPVGNKFEYDGVPGTHQWYDGTPHPWEFKRVWHLEPSLDRSRYGLRRRRRRRPFPHHRRRPDLAGTRRTARPRLRLPMAARRRRHGPAHHPPRPQATPTASSSPSPPPAPSAPTTAAKPGRPSTTACAHNTSPTPTPRSATASTASPCTPRAPNVLFMQKHWDVMRTDNAGDTWHEVSGNLPTDFGFPIDVHAHEPETIYVVPIKSDSRALPARRQAARLSQPHRRQRMGAAHERPAAERLLRERPARRHVRRLARFLRHLLRHHRRTGLRLRRCRRQLGAHRPRPPGRAFRRGPDAANDPRRRSRSPANARAHQRRSEARRRPAPSRSAPSSTRSKPAIRFSAAPSATTSRSSAAPSSASSPAKKTSRTNPPTPRCPPPWRRAPSPSSSSAPSPAAPPRSVTA